MTKWEGLLLWLIFIMFLVVAVKGQSYTTPPNMTGNAQHTVEVNTGVYTASGDRPASDFQSRKDCDTTLGIEARRQKEIHKSDKKSKTVYVN